MSNFENMSPEQQRYTQACAQSNNLFEVQKAMQDLQNQLLSTEFDPLVAAQTANEIGRMVQRSANQAYAVKKDLEQQHPEFKTQAAEYIRSQQQQKTVQQEQSF